MDTFKKIKIMTREEQLIYCNQCVNRKMDFKQGVLCRLTDAKADFYDTCDSFKQDSAIVNSSSDHGKSERDKRDYKLSLLSDDVKSAILKDQKPTLALSVGITGAVSITIINIILGLIGGAEIPIFALFNGIFIAYIFSSLGKLIEPKYSYIAVIITVSFFLINKYVTMAGLIGMHGFVPYTGVKEVTFKTFLLSLSLC